MKGKTDLALNSARVLFWLLPLLSLQVSENIISYGEELRKGLNFFMSVGISVWF